jgi:hypothetical protein
MARVQHGAPRPTTTKKTGSSTPAAQTPAPKAQAPAPKKAAPQPQADRFETRPKQAGSTQKTQSKGVGAPPERFLKLFSDSAQKQIKQLANSFKQPTVNQDGSETRKLEGKTGNGKTVEAELTTSKGLLREAQTKYSKTGKATDANGVTTTAKYEAAAKSDLFGRTTSSQSKEVSTSQGDATKGGEFTTTQGRTEARDQWGLKKETLTNGTKFKTGTDDKHHKTQSQSQAVTTDRFGNRAATNSTSTARQHDKLSVTTGTKNTTGTELNTSSSASFSEGKYSIGESVDWKKHKLNTERSLGMEYQVKDVKEPGGFNPANQNDRLSMAQKGADLLAGAGPKKVFSQGEIAKDKLKENNRVKNDPNTFIGTRHGYAGKHEVALGINGLNASGNIEAKAGAYAETKKGKIDEDKGGKQLNLASKAELKASAEGKAKLDSNGVDASGNAKIGGTVEASATARAQSKSITVAGEKLSVGAEATGKVSASATAEANAKVKITRNPRSAIIEGGLGASAVAKAEAEAKVNAGPFAVKGNVYGSAGAEATAKGSVGYENGKLKINGSLGAAVGLGAGGGVAVEVDVAQIGKMAQNTAKPYVDKAKKVADVNRDGKIDVRDAQAVATKARGTVKSTAQKAKKNFDSAVTTTRRNVDNTVRNVQRNVDSTVRNVQRNVDNTVRNVQRNVDNTVRNVQRNVDSTVRNVQRNVDRTVRNVQRNVDSTVRNVQRNVDKTVKNAQRNVVNTVQNVQRNVDNTINNARNTVNNAANNVKRFFGF